MLCLGGECGGHEIEAEPVACVSECGHSGVASTPIRRVVDLPIDTCHDGCGCVDIEVEVLQAAWMGVQGGDVFGALARLSAVPVVLADGLVLVDLVVLRAGSAEPMDDPGRVGVAIAMQTTRMLI